MTVKRTLIILAALLVALPLAAGLLQQGSSQVAAQDVATPAAQQLAAQATSVPVTTTSEISALGSVEANLVTSLYFQTAGTVKGVYVETGDHVNAGEVLADLEGTSAWNTYNQALLSLESAQLSMEALLAPPTDQEIAVAKANVASAQAAYSSVANGSSDADIETLQLKYDQAAASLEALQTARANMSGSEDEIALQEAKIGAASFSAEIARLQLEAAQEPDSNSLWSASIKIQQAQLQLEQLQAAPTQSEIDSAQLTIDRAQASLETAQKAVLETQLIAPVSGYVTTLNISAGDSVSATTVVMEVSDTSKLQMTVPVNELDVQDVSVGQSAVIQLDALSGVDIAGTVEDVGWLSSTSSDGIVTYDVRVALNTDDSRVRIGMTGEVAIQTGSVS